LIEATPTAAIAAPATMRPALTFDPASALSPCNFLKAWLKLSIADIWTHSVSMANLPQLGITQ
jgi:hypothetical protein